MGSKTRIVAAAACVMAAIGLALCGWYGWSEWRTYATNKILLDLTWPARPLSATQSREDRSFGAAVLEWAGFDAASQTLEPIVRVQIYGPIQGSEHLAALSRLRHLQSLYFLDSGLDDGQVAQLCLAPSLEQIVIKNAKITERSVMRIGEWRNLQSLMLIDCPIEDDALCHLSSLTQLKTLGLSGTRVTGEGLRHLTTITSLDYLSLNSPLVDDR